MKTPIWDKAEQADIEQYKDTDYIKPLERLQKRMLDIGRKGLPPEKIAATVREALFAPSPRAHYTLVPSYFSDVLIPSLLPARMFDRMIAKALGLRKN